MKDFLFKKVGNTSKYVARDFIFAGIISLLLVLTIRFFTNTTPPIHDAVYYVQMAQYGIIGTDNLAAPFIYRFATPMIVRGISALFTITIDNGFGIIAFVSALSLLFLTFLFTRNLGYNYLASMTSTGVIAFSFYHCKYSLFFPTMIDIEAYVLFLIALWMLIKRRFILCVLVSAIGVLFKEFLLIPPALMIIVLIIEFRSSRSSRQLMLIIYTIFFVGIFFILPRLLIPIKKGLDFQDIHHFPETVRLKMMLQKPFNLYKDINILFSWFSYWLPTLILSTPERTNYAWIKLKDMRSVLIIYLLLVLIFTMYGGENISIFVTYSFVAQIILIATFVEYGITTWEILYLFGALIIFNRIFSHVPLPRDDFYGYADFYGGWSSLVTMQTLYRFIELYGYFVVIVLIRKILNLRKLRK